MNPRIYHPQADHLLEEVSAILMAEPTELHERLEELLLDPHFLALYLRALESLQARPDSEEDFELSEGILAQVLLQGLSVLGPAELTRLAVAPSVLSQLQCHIFMVDDPESYWFAKVSPPDDSKQTMGEWERAVDLASAELQGVPGSDVKVALGGISPVHYVGAGFTVVTSVEFCPMARGVLQVTTVLASEDSPVTGMVAAVPACGDLVADAGPGPSSGIRIEWLEPLTSSPSAPGIANDSLLLEHLHGEEFRVLRERFVNYKPVHRIARELGLNVYSVKRICEQRRKEVNHMPQVWCTLNPFLPTAGTFITGPAGASLSTSACGPECLAGDSSVLRFNPLGGCDDSTFRVNPKRTSMWVGFGACFAAVGVVATYLFARQVHGGGGARKSIRDTFCLL